jgi:predicted ATPase/DNA-binding SARP family transcriptional activator
VEIRLLGPLEVIGDGGRPIEVRGAKLSGLLALLALNVGEVVPTSRIIAAIWGERDIRDPVNAAQVLVSKLRRALREGLEPGDRDLIATTAVGYSLTPESVLVDAVRFEDLAVRGRERLAEGDAPAAAAMCCEALDLWRGTALVDFMDFDFTVGARVHLEELRAATIELRVEADLALGRHEELVAELELLVADAPLRERLREQLMLSLYRSGRQADALRAYDAAREMFVEQLGLEPGPELRRLEAAILDQDPALDLDRPSRSATNAGYLPTPVSEFVGRADELAQIDDAMRSSRLVTLVGTGGVGKTRLAIEAARRVRPSIADGCWFVDLAPLTPAQPVGPAVARTLGLDDADRLVDYLAPRRALLVLDNCEHLIDAVAGLVARLLRDAPDLRVLATSREGLGLTGERRWLVPPMSPADANALFVERASEAGSSEDALAPTIVDEVCLRLEGLPLALELAAARTRTLSLADIAVRIEDRFRLLASGDRTAEPRQRTMRGVVEWSYDLLFSDEQRVFRRLSVFAGGFGLDAAERVAAHDDLSPDDVLDLLSHLVDKSLVNVTNRRGETRYQLLQTLADYGRLELAEAGEEGATRARHLEWVVDLASAVGPELRGADQPHAASVMATERDNIRAAVLWAVEHDRAADAVTIVAALGYGWYMTGAIEEGRELLQATLAATADLPPEEAAVAHSWCAWLLQFGSGASSGVVEHAERAIELAAGTSSRVFAVAAVVASLVRGFRGLTDEAAALVAEAVARLEDEPDPWAQSWVDWARSGLALKGGDASEAAARLRSSVAGFESVGDVCGVAIASIRLSELAEGRGDLREAIDSATSAYESVVAFGAQTFNASTLATRLGNLAALEDRYDDAARWHAVGLDRARQGAYPGAVAQALSGAAHAAYRQGRLDVAEGQHREALATYEQTGSVEGVAASLASLGFIATVRGDHDAAEELHGRSLELGSRGGDRRAMALAVEGLAEVRLATGDPCEAGRLLGVAEALRRSGGAPIPSLQPGTAVRTAQEVAAVLGAAELDAIRAEGAGQVDATIAALLAEVGADA